MLKSILVHFWNWKMIFPSDDKIKFFTQFAAQKFTTNVTGLLLKIVFRWIVATIRASLCWDNKENRESASRKISVIPIILISGKHQWHYTLIQECFSPSKMPPYPGQMRNEFSQQITTMPLKTQNSPREKLIHVDICEYLVQMGWKTTREELMKGWHPMERHFPLWQTPGKYGSSLSTWCLLLGMAQATTSAAL